MDQREAFIKAIKILENLEVDYMIVGGFAVSYWGEPRSTHDLDIVIEIKTERQNDLIEVFRENGYYIEEEMVKTAVKKRSMFNILHSDSDLKIDFWIIKDDEYSRERFKRRIKQNLFGIDTFLTSPEDLILMKLEWYRESDINKHFLDAQGIYKLQKDIIDIAYLQKWAERLGINSILEKVVSL